MRRPVRVVEPSLRRVGGVPAGPSRQRGRGNCTSLRPQQDRRPQIPGLQPGHGRLLHGDLSRDTGRGGRVDTRRVQGKCFLCVFDHLFL